MKSFPTFVLAATLALVSAPILHAGDKEPVAPEIVMPESKLDASLRLNAWAASLKGDLGIGGVVAPVDLSFGDIVDNLNMVAAGTFTINNGRWGLLIDTTYIELGAPVPDVPTPLFTIDGITVEQWTTAGLISYRLMGDHYGFLDAIGGVHYMWMRNTFDFSPGPTRTGEKSLRGRAAWVDPIVGLRAEKYVTDKFYVQAAGMIGGFGVSSDLVWIGAAGCGYNFSEKVAIDFVYRYASFDYDRKILFDASMHGPFLGVRIDF